MMERLCISDNGHYLQTESGIPFFWMADTAWTLCSRLTLEETEEYFNDRKRKGFNAVQISVLDPEKDPEMRNVYGEPAIYDSNILKTNEKYWNRIDQVLDMAEKKGFYILLLPAWGQLVTGDNWLGNQFPKIIKEENAEEYGYWLGNRYRNRKNIVWCLGGDRHPVHKGEDFRQIWRKMAQGIARAVTGTKIRWNETSEYWKKILITYHPTISDDPPAYSSSEYFRDDPWLSINMLQSGHRDNVRNYDAIYADYYVVPVKPVWDGEPNYEDWKISTVPGEIKRYHEAWNVRKRAYWSVLAGAFGHTYGHSCIWGMEDEKTKDGEELKYTWKEALNRPGAFQMGYMKRLFSQPDFLKSHPCQEMLICLDNYLDIRKQIRLADDRSFAYLYFTSGGSVVIDLSKMSGEIIKGWWFNPRDGKYYNQNNELSDENFFISREKKELTFQTPTYGIAKDWVLVLKSKF